jgi:ABC-type spermidine/putrescine transport system permease subunit I
VPEARTRRFLRFGRGASTEDVSAPFGHGPVPWPSRRRRAGLGETEGAWYPRWFWPSFSLPATAWLAVLFVLPFYAILSVAFGTIDPIFGTPVPVWNPLHWNFASFAYTANQTFLIGGVYRPAFIRTIEYVVIAVGLSLLIGYPVAYFIARYGGRFKGILLVGLIAPFWISYLMRMLAWVNLLLDDGLVNKALLRLHLIGSPVSWLDGRPYTLVLGLVYGYVPYMILPLFAGLDRIDRSVLEASRDLGAGRARTFLHVTLPLSKQSILAGSIIVMLPMFGDYYTNDLLSKSPRTSMVGNLINSTVNSPQVTQAASLVILLTLLLLLPMLYYLYATNRASRMEAA